MSHHTHQFVSPLSQTLEEKQPVAVRVFFSAHAQWFCGQPAPYFGPEVSQRIMVAVVCGEEVSLTHQGQDAEAGQGRKVQG